MKTLVRVTAVLLLNLRSLPDRARSSVVLLTAIAGTVAVFVSVLAMAAGFTSMTANRGLADRALVLRVGADSEATSTLTRQSARIIADAPGVKKNAAGIRITSAETLAVVTARKRSDGSPANVALRGVGPAALELRPELRLTQGRLFTAGTRELIVGKAAAAQFAGLDVGDRLLYRGGEWTIVGRFETGGDAHESEILADAESVLSASRSKLFQVVVVKLDEAGAFQEFKSYLTSHPALAVDVVRENEYVSSGSKQLARLMRFSAYVIGSLMALGAFCAALNSFHRAVRLRSREMGVLRALGFDRSAVVVPIVVEALLLGMLGGVCGAGLAWIFFDGSAVNTLGGNISQVVFQIRLTEPIAGLGVLWGCAIAIAGALVPAARAARQPIVQVLRSG